MPRSSVGCRNTWPPGWLTPRRCGCWTAATFGPSRDGSPRQYCGRLGKVANCQAGMFLAYVSPLGQALVNKGLYLPESWISDQDRCAAAGVPEERLSYRSKTELALELLERALGLGHLKAGSCRGRRLRDVAVLSGVPGGPGDALRAGRSGQHSLAPGVGPVPQGSGRPRKPRLRDGQRRTMEQRSGELPDKAWREITVAQGSQGPRSYMFSAQRVRVTRKGKPGQEAWAVYRRNLDGSEPRYYLSNAAEDTPLETLAYVGARWPIETEFETEKGDVGLDEYETRLVRLASPHSHVPAGWSHGPAAGLGGKRCPGSPAPGVPGGAGNAAPGTVRTGGVAAVQHSYATSGRRSHQRRRSARREGRMEPPP